MTKTELFLKNISEKDLKSLVHEILIYQDTGIYPTPSKIYKLANYEKRFSTFSMNISYVTAAITQEVFCRYHNIKE